MNENALLDVSVTCSIELARQMFFSTISALILCLLRNCLTLNGHLITQEHLL